MDVIGDCHIMQDTQRQVSHVFSWYVETNKTTQYSNNKDGLKVKEGLVGKGKGTSGETAGRAGGSGHDQCMMFACMEAS
jgi:hypothetical protein